MKKLWNIATSTDTSTNASTNTSTSTSTTISSTSVIKRIIIIFTTVVSVTQIETTNASSSIPRSTNSRSYSNSIPSSTSSTSSSSSNKNNNNNHNDNGNVNVNDVPPWNISPKIDSEGFITSSFSRIPGEWELEANIGGKYAELGTIDADNNGNNKGNSNADNHGNKYGSNHGGTRTSTTTTNKVMIRQVPGDGNCLFHSITVSMALVMNSTHIDMVGSSRDSNNRHTNNQHPRRRNNKRGKQMKNAFFGNNYSKINTSSRSTSTSTSKSSTSSTSTSQNDTNNPNDNHNYDLKHLYQHSQYLREKAVDVLSNNPRRLLFLQGNEYLRARDLVNAAAAQYDLTGEKYCELMRKESYWGGGPEIVALCNYLKRPIHVYELSSDCDNGLEGGGDRSDSGDSGDSHNSHNSSSNGEDEEEGKKMVETGRRSNNLRRYDLNGKKQLESPQFKLRRMACFGSPKFDRKEPLHILSADSRFPDIEPGKQLSSGNHFMALFPEDLIHAVNREKKRIRRRKKSAGVRGGGVGNNSGNGSGVNNDSVTGTGTGTTGLTSSIHGRESSNYSKRRKKKNRDVRSDSKHHQRQLGRHRDRTSYRLVSSNRRGKVMDRIWSRGVLGICQSFMRWMLCL